LPFGSGAVLNPFLADAANEFGELVGIGAFDVIFASAEVGCAPFVVGKFEAAQDADGYPAEFGGGPKPFEDLEAGHPRHVQIEDDKVGGRTGDMIGIRSVSLKIGKNLLAISDNLEGVVEFGAGKSPLEEEPVVFLIFGYENRCGASHISPVSV